MINPAFHLGIPEGPANTCLEFLRALIPFKLIV
jgi:hypothetical protein